MNTFWKKLDSQGASVCMRSHFENISFIFSFSIKYFQNSYRNKFSFKIWKFIGSEELEDTQTPPPYENFVHLTVFRILNGFSYFKRFSVNFFEKPFRHRFFNTFEDTYFSPLEHYFHPYFFVKTQFSGKKKISVILTVSVKFFEILHDIKIVGNQILSVVDAIRCSNFRIVFKL